MKDPKKTALKRLKRRRKIAGRRKYIQDLKRGGFIIWGNGNIARTKPPKEKKPKVKKEMKGYLAAKLTVKLDTLNIAIREANPNDPKLPKMKAQRDRLRARLIK